MAWIGSMRFWTVRARLRRATILNMLKNKKIISRIFINKIQDELSGRSNSKLCLIIRYRNLRITLTTIPNVGNRRQFSD